ncbi:hypothetical protein J6590_056865 [Homalodisca vitripennis]|nr:hypothetical protein J6590_056865 [Homalodisca vitripennis]
MGVFNIDALDSVHPSTVGLVDILRLLHLTLLVKSPTRVTPTSIGKSSRIIQMFLWLKRLYQTTMDPRNKWKKLEREPKMTKLIRDTRIRERPMYHASRFHARRSLCLDVPSRIEGCRGIHTSIRFAQNCLRAFMF